METSTEKYRKLFEIYFKDHKLDMNYMLGQEDLQLKVFISDIIVPEVSKFPPTLRKELENLKFIKERKRCEFPTCNKKTGLLGFECRCGNKYCTIHRFPDQHSCKFDFKSHGKELLRKQNQVVTDQKLVDRI